MKITEEIFYKHHFSEEFIKVVKKQGTRTIKTSLKFLETYQKIPKAFLKSFKFPKKIKFKEKLYIKFLITFLSQLDQNNSDIGKGLKKLLDAKDYKSSMFLLRGFIESCLFNFYITFKMNNLLEKNDHYHFIRLLFKASYSSDQPSFKIMQDKKNSSIIKKIIENRKKGNRIHINDCIKFYRKKDFSKILSNSEFIRSLQKSSPNIKTKTKKFLRSHDNEFLYYVYDKLCEIIHPTAMALHTSDDDITEVDFKSLVILTTETNILMLNLHCVGLKTNIVNKVIKNKNDYISNFKKILND